MASRAVPLSDLAIINPKHEKGTSSNTPVSFVSMSDVDSESASVTHEELRTFEETAKGFTQFKKGDILLAKITPCFENGKIAQATISESLGSGSTEFHVIRAREGSADPRFLLHMLRHPKIIFDGERKMTGSSGHRRVPETYVSSIAIPNYPLGTQRKIGGELDTLESLKAKRRRSIELLDELTQSVFLDMFGDPKTNPKNWEIRQLSELFEEKPNYGTMTPASNNGDWLCLRVANIQNWEISLDDRKYVNLDSNSINRHAVEDGDILLARAIATQEHLGKAIVAQTNGEKWAFDSHLMRIRLNKNSAQPEFIRHLLRSPGGRQIFLRATRRSAVQFNINTKEISKLEIPVPPISAQYEFIEALNRIENLKTKHQTHLSYLDELFASVQQRAFDGTLWDDPDVAA